MRWLLVGILVTVGVAIGVMAAVGGHAKTANDVVRTAAPPTSAIHPAASSTEISPQSLGLPTLVPGTAMQTVPNALTTQVASLSGTNTYAKSLDPSTRPFTVRQDWALWYSYTCASTSTGKGSFGIKIVAPTGDVQNAEPVFDSPTTLVTTSGQGVVTYAHGGTYQMTVDTPCRYTVTVYD